MKNSLNILTTKREDSDSSELENPWEYHPHETMPSALLEYQTKGRRKSKTNSKSRHKSKVQPQLDSFSPSGSPLLSSKNDRTRKSRVSSKSETLKGAELVRAEIMNEKGLKFKNSKQSQQMVFDLINKKEQSGGANDSSNTVTTQYKDVLNDLETTLIKQNKNLNRKTNKEEERKLSPNSPKSVAQFESYKQYHSHLRQTRQDIRDFDISVLDSVNKNPNIENNRLSTSTNPSSKSQPFNSGVKRSSFQTKNKKECISKKPSLSAFPPLNIRESDSFQHAQRAGLLWQTIVGTFVRFPTTWFNGYRTPEMGIPRSRLIETKWNFVCLLRLQDKYLSSYVKEKQSSGKLLLHVIITDSQFDDVKDIAIGCFHPKANRIYTDNPHVEGNPEDALTDNSYRDVWMALRKAKPINDRKSKKAGKKVSWLEKYLTLGQSTDIVGRDSPISNSKRSVSNLNVRSIFGHCPPRETIRLSSEQLKNIIKQADVKKGEASSPAILLMRKFLYKK